MLVIYAQGPGGMQMSVDIQLHENSSFHFPPSLV